MKYILIGNGQEWCYYSWIEFVKANKSCISFYNSIIPIANSKFFTNLCYRYFTRGKKSIKGRFFYRFCYWLIYKTLVSKDTRFLLIYDWSQYTKDLELFSYIKTKNPKITLVYLFSNIINISGAKKFEILNCLNDYFDQVYAFDMLDAQKYGFRFNNLIYYGNTLSNQFQFEYDIFYVGNAKDRLDELHDIFCKVQRAKLKSKFFIVGVPEEKQLYKDGIVYNQIITYKEVLEYISRSRCIVDIIQGGSTAMTIKVCEAVLYDKKLITSNKNITSEPYYSSNNILVYDSTSSEDIKSFMDVPNNSYRIEDKKIFSPEELFSKISQ